VSDILAEICANKTNQVSIARQNIPEHLLRSKAESYSKTLGFSDALSKSITNGGIGLITEIKKASPSKGLIRNDFNPYDLAIAYVKGGASCLSVLTESDYFQGSNLDLENARSAVNVPILRKDFILDPYQVFETRALGADCILLIMAALEYTLAEDMAKEAKLLGMDVLAEVHDENELESAINLRPTLIGINNRNLKTLNIDLGTTERLAAYVPDDIDVVCESGIYSNVEITKICSFGIKRFLVGESLMCQDNVEAATRDLIGK